MTVILLTCEADRWVPDVVIDAVVAGGRTCLRVDSDLFPGTHTLNVDDDGAWQLRVHGQVVDDVAAVWCRRRWPGLGLAVDERYLAGCAAQGRSLLHAWLRDLGRLPDAAALDAFEKAEAGQSTRSYCTARGLPLQDWRRVVVTVKPEVI